MNKPKFLKLRMMYAIFRGRTVIYKAEIDMIQNIVNFTTSKGYMINSTIIFPEYGDGKIE